MKIGPVFPRSYGDDAAADGWGRTMSAVPIGIPCGGNDYDTHAPEPLYGFLQRQVDLAVIGADGKIYYFDIIFAGVVHYPSKSCDRLYGIALPLAV